MRKKVEPLLPEIKDSIPISSLCVRARKRKTDLINKKISIYRMSDTMLRISCALTYLIVDTDYEVGTVLIPILWLRKSRLKDSEQVDFLSLHS